MSKIECSWGQWYWYTFNKSPVKDRMWTFVWARKCLGTVKCQTQDGRQVEHKIVWQQIYAWFK